MIKIIAFVIYILLVFCIHGFIIDISYLILFFIDIPLCSFLVCCIHECTHFLFFLYAGAEVKSVRLGAVKISKHKKKIKAELTNDNMYTGCCIVKTTNYKAKSYMIVALLSGGISSIAVAVIIFLYTIWAQNKISPFLLCMALIGVISGSFSLVYPNSADRKLLKLFLIK